MSERLKRYLMAHEIALGNLRCGTEQANDYLKIDGTIRRFEICYELLWRFISEYLADMGIVCNNPRDCFKSAFANNLIDSEDTWLKIIEDRHKVAALYTILEAKIIFQRIKGIYISEFSHVFTTLKQKTAEM